MVYVDVTDEVEDHITSEKQISYRQGRIEVAEDIKATAENEIDLSKSVDFNKPLYNVIERCNALITNQSKEKE